MRGSVSKSRWGRLVLVVTAAAAMLAGCGVAESQQAAVTVSPSVAATLDAVEATLAPSWPTLGSLRQGDLLAWLSSDPVEPVVGTATIDAFVVGADGKPVTDAKVTFDTDMTNMSHGVYLVEAQAVSDGHYAGQVRFSMPGPWRVIAIVERPGQETAKLRFKFSVNAR